MGCDYFADKNGVFKVTIMYKDFTHKERTVELKELDPEQGVYDDIDYDSDCEEIEVMIGCER